MAEGERISPAETREKVKSGQGLLVCGYSDAERCKNYPIEGAISFQEFESRVPAIPKNQETIFYCDLPQEGTSAGQAAKYLKMGYPNVKTLGGGFKAWRNAGYR